MTSLLDALASRYVPVRELGRGGMATVYLVRDLRHERLVALKVLRPELAEVGTYRFVREIRVTARLQHPHILPVFDSGHAAGQLWYTMPYVEGESLRDRLDREAQLPLGEALRLTLEVADALHHAHAHGILHRDIKPGNILLSGGHALVADFGLALALGGPSDGSLADQRLTSAGLAVGTPAYMSPEQLLDGQRVDARSDVYALACVLYEMLSGEPPHLGPSPQAIVARRLSDPVPSVRTVRDTVPPVLDETLRTALARRPADRFDSMGAFALALQQAGSESAAPVREGRRPAVGRPGFGRAARRWAVAAAVMVAGAAVYLAVRARAADPPTLFAAGVLHQRDPLLIADFRSRPADSALATMVTEIFRIDLAQSPAVTIVPPSRTGDALARMQRAPGTRLDLDVARELALREGIKAVVGGEVLSAGSRYVISVRVISASGGDLILGRRETASDSTELLSVVDRLSAAVREQIGESLRSIRSDPPLQQVTTASLEALRKYTQAVQAGRRAEVEQQIALLEEAIALDSGFAMAYADLGRALGPPAPAERRVRALTRAYELRDRLPARERHAATASYYSNVTFELSKAAAAHRARLELHPGDLDAQLSLGHVYLWMRKPAEAEEAFARGVALDSSDASTYQNLAEAQMIQGKVAEAGATIERMTKAFPDNPEVEWWAIQYVGSSGDYAEAETRARALLERYGGDPYHRHWTDATLAALSALQGKVEQARYFIRDAMTAVEEEGHVRSYHELAALLAFYDLRYAGRPRRALEEMHRALTRFPMDSMPPIDRPYLTLATLYALAGEPGLARATLDEYERVTDPNLREAGELLERSRHGAYGELALAEGRVSEAIAHFRLAASRGLCIACGFEGLGRAWEAAGQPDSALGAYHRRITINHLQRFVMDAVELPLVYRRLGDLHAARGDRAQAREYYSRLLGLWKDCDADLRPVLAETRRRIAELEVRPRAPVQ